jgi:tetratricopeptide (TPR) repeat protein
MKKKNNFDKQILIIYIVLTLSTFAVFWQVRSFDFVNFDDTTYVTVNDHIKSGMSLEALRWSFSTFDADFWHPLTWISFMLDYQLHELNPGGYHMTNVVLHVLTTLLLFGLLNRMTGSIWRSAFVAAVFGLHPLHVESVAWIAKRKDVLCSFFWMLTLCLYVLYREKQDIKRYLFVLFSFLMALLSKPMAVTLPVIMILLDYWPLGLFRFQKGETNVFLKQLIEKTPFFILSAIFSIITIYARPYLKTLSEDHDFYSYLLISRLANAPISFITYLEKTFWPRDMAVYYPFALQIHVWKFLGSVILIIIISFVVVKAMKRLPYLFVGWLWYSTTILPVIGVMQVSSRIQSDNYTYLPSIGIFMMVAWGIPLLIPGEELQKKILLPISIIILTFLAILSWQQCGYWKNSIELWNHTLRVTKNNYMAHTNLARFLAESGRKEEAIEHFSRVISIKPKVAHSYFNRGVCYCEMGKYLLAIPDFNAAINLKPDYLLAYNNRGIAYAETGQYQKALEDFDKAIRLNPNFSDSYYNRGCAYNKIGEYTLAVKDFNDALRLNPNFTEGYNNRGLTYLNHGNTELGCYDAQKACALGDCELLEYARTNKFCR